MEVLGWIMAAGLIAWMLAVLFVFLSQPTYSPSPVPNDGPHWEPVPTSDAVTGGGTSMVRVRSAATGALSFDYKLTKVAKYPYAGTRIVSKDAKGRLAPIALSKYDTISFVARCSTADPMMLGMTVFDDKVSVPGQLLTYRSPGTFFSCRASARQIRSLEPPAEIIVLTSCTLERSRFSSQR